MEYALKYYHPKNTNAIEQANRYIAAERLESYLPGCVSIGL